MFILQLNDMRHPKAEIKTPVFRAETHKELIDFLAREVVKPYRDINGPLEWLKNFRKGGPLEWFNPEVNMDSCIFDAGTVEDWQERAVKWFEEEVLVIPTVPSILTVAPSTQ